MGACAISPGFATLSLIEIKPDQISPSGAFAPARATAWCDPGAWTLAQARTAAKTTKTEITAADTKSASVGIATSIEAHANIALARLPRIDAV
jgi:hypothetical protein